MSSEATDLVFTEATTAIRDWLRTVTGIAALAGQRVWAGGYPDDPTLPAVVIFRVSGAPEPHGPLDDGVYQLDCTAATGTAAGQLAGAVITALQGAAGVNLGGALTLLGAQVTEATWAPDPASDTPRYALTATITTKTS